MTQTTETADAVGDPMLAVLDLNQVLRQAHARSIELVADGGSLPTGDTAAVLKHLAACTEHLTGTVDGVLRGVATVCQALANHFSEMVEAQAGTR